MIAFGVAVAVLIGAFLWHAFGALRERQQARQTDLDINHRSSK